MTAGKESKLQTEISRWLRSKGCFVMTIQPQAGIPTGTPDIIFMCEGFWGAIEVKKENPYRKDGRAKANAFQPLQQERIKKFNEWSWARVAYPENWESIRTELEHLL